MIRKNAHNVEYYVLIHVIYACNILQFGEYRTKHIECLYFEVKGHF